MCTDEPTFSRGAVSKLQYPYELVHVHDRSIDRAEHERSGRRLLAIWRLPGEVFLVQITQPLFVDGGYDSRA